MVRASRGVLQGHGDQRDADDGEDRADDDRREVLHQPAEERGEQEGRDARRDHRSVDDEQSGGTTARSEAYGDHGRDRGEGDALDQGQPGADLPHAEGLDDRRHAAGQEVRVDEVDQLRAGEAQRVPEQDRDDDGRRVEREDVLESVQGELGEGESFVDRVRLRPGGLTGHSCHLCLAFAR